MAIIEFNSNTVNTEGLLLKSGIMRLIKNKIKRKQIQLMCKVYDKLRKMFVIRQYNPYYGFMGVKINDTKYKEIVINNQHIQIVCYKPRYSFWHLRLILISWLNNKYKIPTDVAEYIYQYTYNTNQQLMIFGEIWRKMKVHIDVDVTVTLRYRLRLVCD